MRIPLLVTTLGRLARYLSGRYPIIRDQLTDRDPESHTCTNSTLFHLTPLNHALWVEGPDGCTALDIRKPHMFRIPHGSHHITVSFSGTSRSGLGTRKEVSHV